MAPKNENPLICLPNVGCHTVIEMSKAMAAATQHIKDHSKESSKFWEGYKKDLENTAFLFKECLAKAQAHNANSDLRFNDGQHRMQNNEDDIDALAEKQRKHVFGKYGMHTITNIVIVAIIGWLSGVTILLALTHPEFIDATAKYFGLV